jgi:hypothetical protein
MSGVQVTYPVGGWLDYIKRMPAIVISQMPNTPTKFIPFSKGFRIDVPALPGDYQVVYTTPVDMELASISTACSGYADLDYWELFADSDQIFETMYTREVPEAHSLGAGSGTLPVPAGTVITMNFRNDSSTSKVVWFNLRLLK